MVAARADDTQALLSNWRRRRSCKRWGWRKCSTGRRRRSIGWTARHSSPISRNITPSSTFYEPFLAAYDPVLRKRLGVWFTPPEIVRYMVARIDRVLRDQLKVADGFADPNVFVLDPCCGTGAFLVEVLRHIETTLKAAGGTRYRAKT